MIRIRTFAALITTTLLASFTPTFTNAQPAPISSNQPAFIPLGDLDGGNFFSAASGISGDGTIVTRTSISTDGQLPYIWTQVGGINDLINGVALGIRAANGSAISADGSVIVGT